MLNAYGRLERGRVPSPLRVAKAIPSEIVNIPSGVTVYYTLDGSEPDKNSIK